MTLLLLLSSNVSFAQKKVIGYLPTWANFPNIVNTLELNKLTHINIAFANPNSSGMLAGPSNSSVTTVVNAAHAKGVKVFISIGGAGASGSAYQAQLNNTTSMNNFVNNLVQYTVNLNLDGIDVDIEGDVLNGSTVTATQYQNFIVKLGTELRAKNKQMTAALAGWFAQYVTNTAAAQFDWINIMSYDAAGSWSGPGQHSPYSLAVNDFNFWKNSKGVPAAKLVIGVPFYGYGWGTYGNNGSGQYIAYSTIIDNHGGSINSDQVGSGNNVIYYNGIPTIKSKANYALQQNAGGIMIWELSQDLTGSRSLLNAIYEVLGTSNPPIPQGPFNGVRTNFPGKLEAENYDVGGQGVAYNDLTVGNEGNTFRTDDVDIQATTDVGAGNNIGWLSDGEWMEYSVTVANSAAYTVEFRTASTTGGAIRMELDGADVTGTVALPNTTAWQTWATTTKTNVTLSAGQHIVRLFAVTGGFNLNYINVVAPPNQLPTVNITAPAVNTTYTAPATISIAANASDADGSIAKVEFYNGATKLGEDLTSPYTFSWGNVSAGTYNITARATDNSNAVTTSGAVSVTVNTPPNQLPTVSITAPAANATFTAPATISIAANASDADGTVSKVEFYNGATKLGEDLTSPYTFSWGNVSAGTYNITARATDNSNAVTTSGAVSVTVTTPPNNCPNLTWSDEFNGTSLDMSKWNYQTGDGCPSLCGWGNNELEYYTSSTNNISVSGGNLAITARYEPNYNGTGKNYTSGKLVTLGKFSQKYGRYEARIKVPSTAGIWPAFWMLADNTSWPATGEIDILECANANPTTWFGTLHYGTPSGGYQHKGSTWNSPVPLSNDFHTYAAEWTTDKISWYIDGTLRGTVTKTELVAGGGAWPFDAQKFYIILNLAVGGNFSGQTPVSSQYPVSMLVDYVKVYSGDPCVEQQSPYNGTVANIPGTIQAENYDLGGQGVAYNDSEAANQGTSYRTEGVDIEATTDAGGGYNVGWTADGEWLEYTVNIASTANYDAAIRTAGTVASALRIEIDGVDRTGTIALPNTTGWQTWATTTKTNIALTAGQHILRVFVVTGGFNLNSIVFTPTPIPQSPYNNTVAAIPGTIQAENYDLGGQGIAYNDSETTNQGTSYRTDGVDIEATTDAGGGYNVGWTVDGEWLEYTVNVASTGNYDAAIRTAGTAASGMRIEIDGVDKTGTIALPNTTGWQTWSTTTKTNIALTAGQHVLRVFVVTGGFNLNSIVFTPTPAPQSPYNNVMASIPGKIEAENYDLGGQGIAYNDVTTANEGGAYRNDAVDVQATTDAGAGYNVGYIADGEWLEYTVNVTASGAYDLAFRTASTGGGAIRMEVDGADISGTLALPNTGAWQTWATTNRNNVTLSAGQHVVRLFVVTGGFNLNYVTVNTHVVDQGPGFLHASGKNIVNTQGNFVIRAANIGNMMVQEGYMLNLGGGYQHTIMQKISDVVGVANKDKFYNDYRNNYLTKADIDSLAKWGFNSIRLPMHYNLFTPLGQPTVFYESGFAKVDEIISWCKANNMYVILDLHAAPGGQSSGDISDYVAGQPSLWESAANRAQTVALWKKFAERYVNEQYVGGYDLINETNWTLSGNTLLAQLMKDITAAIRQVDQNHLLFIEGNSYANDYTGLTPKWDTNMAYSFHKYWNDVNDASINWVLALRDAQNVPIWLGEFGENSNHWIAETVTLMNNHNIGWAVWPYKKMSSTSCIGSFKEPANWSVMSGYINGGAAPSAATAQAILNELAENVKISKTTVNYGYLYALFGAPSNTTRAYESVSLPGKLSAAKYDEGKNGQAYSDVVYQTAQFGSGGGSFVAWNTGYASRNDGVDLQFSASENANTVGWTENNEWMHYTVNVSASGSYTVKARVAGNGGTISLASDGVTIINAASVPATGGWDIWQTVTLGTVSLSAGTHKLRITISTAGYNLNFLEFTTTAATSQAQVNTVSANSCSSVPQYVENGGYVAGSRVQNAGGLFECKPNPYSGWCNGAAWAYGPGTGSYWSDAWIKVSNCNARIGETESLTGTSYVVTSLTSAPNPFNSVAKVEVSLAQSGDVSLEVYDNTGILVKVLYKGYLDSGSYSYEFDSGNLKSDLYLVKLNSNQQVFTQKIIKIQ